MRRSGRVLEYRSGFRSIRHFGSRFVRQCRGLDLPCRNLDYSEKKQSKFPILITRAVRIPEVYFRNLVSPPYVWIFLLSCGGVSFSANLPSPPASIPENANAMRTLQQKENDPFAGFPLTIGPSWMAIPMPVLSPFHPCQALRFRVHCIVPGSRDNRRIMVE